MCFICLEITKENLSALQVKRFMTELVLGSDNKHLEQFYKAFDNTSDQYRKKLDDESETLDPDLFDDPLF